MSSLRQHTPEEHEAARLKALFDCHILDTPHEKKYDDIALLASTICETPIAIISFVDQKRKWFKSKVGLKEEHIKRKFAFCDYIISHSSGPMIINDTLEDAQFCDNPLVTPHPNIRFYAGFPLIISGQVIGSLCVIDTIPRELTGAQKECLRTLTSNICSLIESDKYQIERNNLKAAMEVALRGVAELDPEGCFVNINDKLVEKLGYSREEISKLHLTDVISESEKNDAGQLLKDALTEGCKNGEFQAVRKNGQHIFINMIIVAKHDQNHHSIGYYCFIQNITPRKTIEQELIEIKNFQDLVLKHHPDYVFVKDKDYRIVLGNDMFLSLYPEDIRDNVLGTTTIEEYDEEQAKEFLANDKKAFEEGSSTVLEKIDCPDGQQRILNTKKVRFENMENEAFILGIARDVTQREHLIRKLQASNEALDEFAYIASHDLKEPVRGIASHIYMLERAYGKDIPDDVARRIERIKSLTEYMGKLIGDLLHYSRLSHIELAWQRVDLNDMVSELSQILTDSFTDKVVVNVEKLPEILCDKIRLQEVFRNLLTNAVKYNKNDIKKIDIKASMTSEHHIISISDNGIGIAEEHQDVIFRIFKRLHHKDQYGGGMGTGLTFVKKIMERHDGFITLKSELHKGTTFFLTIPRKKSLKG
ncbi:MAG: ATP-binding protein [Pseudomonadota bacterium]